MTLSCWLKVKQICNVLWTESTNAVLDLDLKINIAKTKSKQYQEETLLYQSKINNTFFTDKTMSPEFNLRFLVIIAIHHQI